MSLNDQNAATTQGNPIVKDEKVAQSWISKNPWLGVFVALAVGFVLGLFAGRSANAQVPTSLRNVYSLGMVSATASSTFATTSYADLPAATITFTPARDPTQTDAPGTNQFVPRLRIVANLDVTKATATTGTCAIYVNGAVVAATARTIDTAAKEGTMSLLYDVALTSAGSQVVKLQCKSGDTNTFTVNSGVLLADEQF